MNSDNEQYLAILRENILSLLSQNHLSIDALCKKMQTSRSQLHRKIKESTGFSTSIFIRSVKLERATKLLEDKDLSVSEVAYQAGFNNPQELSKYFKNAHGRSPTQFRKNKLRIKDTPRLKDEDPGDDGRKSIVILPFENRSPHAGDDYLSDGIAEEIMFGLSTVQALKVMGRASSFYFRNSSVDVREIAYRLKVNFLLLGSVLRIESELKIIVQLINGDDGYQIWTEKFQRKINDLFSIQEEIAFQVVNKLKLTISPQERWNKSFRKTDNIDAYQLYLQGRREFEQRKDLKLALHYFEQAKDVDPDFAYAHIGIAFTYIYYCIFISYPPLLALPRIKSAYESALQLDPNIPEAFIIEGWIHFYYNHKPDKAIASIDKALALQPDSMDALRIKAYFYSFTGRNDQALTYGKMAYALDPMGFNAWFSYGDMFRRAQKYRKALELLLPLKEQFGANVMVDEIIGICYYYLGRLDEVADLYKPFDQHPPQIGYYTIGRYIYHYYHGDKSLLPSLLQYLEAKQDKAWIQPTILAMIYFHLGDESRAEAAIDRAIKESDFGLMHIKSNQYWYRFMDHPVVVEVLRKTNSL